MTCGKGETSYVLNGKNMHHLPKPICSTTTQSKRTKGAYWRYTCNLTDSQISLTVRLTLHPLWLNYLFYPCCKSTSWACSICVSNPWPLL